jgi:hypothetical protein
MPIDKPKAGETEEEYLEYCIPEEIKAGKEPDVAAGICYSIYREEKMTAQQLFIKQFKEYVKANSR